MYRYELLCLIPIISYNPYLVGNAEQSIDKMSSIKRFGDPTWLVLSTLSSESPIPNIEIKSRIDDLLKISGYLTQEIDPSTLHHSIKSLMELGLVISPRNEIVPVPTGRGRMKNLPRPLYQLTEEGEELMEARRRLLRATLDFNPEQY